MITLITLTQGNVNALKRTVDNVVEQFNGLVNEVIIGDLCIFKEDSQAIKQQEYQCEYKRIVHFAFNSLFNEGFGAVLNQLGEYSTNDLCLYMNVGEIVEDKINLSVFKPEWNCYKFNHATDPHEWIRLWNKTQLKWSGRIHEEVVGKKYLCPDLIFQMADTEKDSQDTFKANIYNDIKELVYFNQYIKLIDDPSSRGATNVGWITYASQNYNYTKQRLKDKGQRYEAFLTGDLALYLNNCQNIEGFENNKMIHFQ